MVLPTLDIYAMRGDSCFVVLSLCRYCCVIQSPIRRGLALSRVFNHHGHGQALLFPDVGGATRPYGLGPARTWRPLHLVIGGVLAGAAASLPRPSEKGVGDLLQGLCRAHLLHMRRDRPPRVPAAVGP